MMQILNNPSMSNITAQDAPSGSNSSSDSAGGSANITANDFLQLLVAEMKNQDPTADTDPNAYIDQLVQVNSLQQLIQINQDLGGDASNASSNAASAPSSGSASVSSQAIGAASRLASSLAPKQPSPTNSDVHPALQSQSVASPKPAVHKA
jgi:flagellar basal-body rod modification protein FlgD